MAEIKVPVYQRKMARDSRRQKTNRNGEREKETETPNGRKGKGRKEGKEVKKD